MASLLDSIKRYQHAIEKYPDDQERVLKSIEKLYNLKVTVQHLQDTGVGRTVNALRKEPGTIGNSARALVNKWKLMVAAEENSDSEEHNHDSSKYNGHGSGKNSDDNANQSRTKSVYDTSDDQSRKQTDYRSTNGNHSGSKKRHHSSEDEESDSKKPRHSESYSDNNDEVSDARVNSDQSESESDSESQSDDSDSSTSSVEPKKEVRVKSEPIEKHHSIHKSHSYLSDVKKETSRSSHDSIRQVKEERHESSKHKQEYKVSDHSKNCSSSKEKHSSSHQHKSSKDHDSSDKKQKSTEKEISSSRHSEKHSSSSHKPENSEKHKSRSEKQDSKTEKQSSSHSHSSEKEKSNNSSGKESKDKHRSKEGSSSSSSKEKHSSLSEKEKSREKTSSSKEKSSHSHKSEKKSTSSSDSKAKSSDSKSKSVKASDSSSDRSSKHKSSSSSSHKTSKAKDEPKKKPQTTSEDSNDGIDCVSGASFAEALGMMSPAKSKKKLRTPTKETSSPLSSFNDLGPAAMLAPTARLAPLPLIEISALPEISPNYKPRPPPKLLSHLSDEDAMNMMTISSKNQRTKVYSGNKVLGKVPSLYEMCVNILQEHIDALEYTGGVPYDILKPVVDKASPQQLFVLEHFNPYLMEDTDHLWQKNCEKHFRNKRRQEMETWREMYIRCQEEQEDRLKSLTANIKMTQEAKKAPIKQTKMAYVDSMVKPPRNIARKQAQHGTARMASASPAARVASLAAAPNVARVGAPRPPGSAPAPIASFKPKKAPLMQKALQLLRGRKR